MIPSSSAACGPFFISPNRGALPTGVNPSPPTVVRAKNVPKDRSSSKKSKAQLTAKAAAKKNANGFFRGGSAESLLQSAAARNVLVSESHQNLSRPHAAANSLPKCGNYVSGTCMSGDPALFHCAYCHKKYCHICAVNEAGKKCPKKPNKTHAVVALDDDHLSEESLSPSAKLNVPKNPEALTQHKFTIKCTNCGDIREFKVNSKNCESCHAELQVDLNLYNPCPNCDLLNSKDAISCELCSSDIIPID